jgi:WD repeat-containing protein 19
MYLPLSLEGP